MPFFIFPRLEKTKFKFNFFIFKTYQVLLNYSSTFDMSYKSSNN